MLLVIFSTGRAYKTRTQDRKLAREFTATQGAVGICPE